MTTSWSNIEKGGIIAELWSSSYEPWLVTEQPWLNENTEGGTSWDNLTKS